MMTGASPSVGSSSSSSRAPVRRMRPIASICCSPPDSLVPWLEPSRSFKLGNSANIWSSESPPGLTTGGSSRFSSTLRLANTPRSSGHNAMPARAIWLDMRLIISRPSKRTEPVRWPTMPMIDFIVVVLPAPLRPSNVTTSPSRTSKSTPCRICDSPYQACRSLIASRGAVTSSMTGPHVGFAHFRIVRHGFVVAFCQHAPARQHRDLVGQIGDDRKIVLDHEHGAVGGDALDQLRNAGDILMAHTGGRFVEQQHFRIERQRGGDFERALAAIRQFDRDPIGKLRKTDIGDQFHRPLIVLVENGR